MSELAAPAAQRTLVGHFAHTNTWTTINSAFEGHFMERLASGSLRKTLAEGQGRIKLLFQHGQDAEVGKKPIGKITALREDDRGGYFEAQLFRGLPPLVEDGLQARAYGMSFTFAIIREQVTRRPAKSQQNPQGLTATTLNEIRVHEFGPVTFPAYATPTAELRSDDASRGGSLPPDRWEQTWATRRLGPLGRLREAAAKGNPTRTRAREALSALDGGSSVEVTWGTGDEYLVRDWRRLSRASAPRRSLDVRDDEQWAEWLARSSREEN